MFAQELDALLSIQGFHERLQPFYKGVILVIKECVFIQFTLLVKVVLFVVFESEVIGLAAVVHELFCIILIASVIEAFHIPVINGCFSCNLTICFVQSLEELRVCCIKV